MESCRKYKAHTIEKGKELSMQRHNASHLTGTVRDPSKIQSLQAMIRGSVSTSGEEGYDGARATWNRSVEQFPVAVVRVASTSDIISTINFARTHGLPVAVQSTGHGVAVPCDEGILINTSQMKGIHIDPIARTARVEPGVKWGEVLQQAQTFGLAPLLGSSPDVGVVGYSLGGGIGWLVRKYGLAADHIRSLDLVAADGRLLQVNQASYPDLFWGLRGGGGNFGIVISLECALFPVDRIYGGSLFYPAERAKDILTAYGAWAPTVPDEMTTSINILRLPSSPDVPEPVRGKTVCVVRACYVGSEQEGAALLSPLRVLGTPLADTFKMMSFLDVGTIDAESTDPKKLYTHAMLLKNLSPESIHAIDSTAGTYVPSRFIFVEIRQLGGVESRLPADTDAWSHRDAPFMMIMGAMVRTPEEIVEVRQYTHSVVEELLPSETGRVYLNFLSVGDTTPTSAGYSPEHYQRLVALKEQYDPTNMFRFNHNIPISRNPAEH
jgi:hypothetical protein